jgi:hypothetical protein
MKLLETPPLERDDKSKQILRVFLANRKLQVAAALDDVSHSEQELAYVLADAMRHLEAASRAEGNDRSAAEIFSSFQSRINALSKRAR